MVRRMNYNARFRLFPSTPQRESLDWVRDIVRQVRNHGLHRFNRIPEEYGTVKQRVTKARDELPELKNWWNDLNNVYSTVLQQAITQIGTDITNLGKAKDNGSKVGTLNWKSPREFRSFTYVQTGFELDKKSGPNGRGLLTLKKVQGENIEVPIRLHRDFPDHNAIKRVSIKKEPTGAWYASFSLETEMPEKPAPETIDVDDCVGIDLGINNLLFDSDGISVGRLDLSDDRRREEKASRSLSRKQHESNNWENQRRELAQIRADMVNKTSDLKHKLAHHYTTENDLVVLENLNVRGMLESHGNARNKKEVGWSDIISVFEHHGDKNACHVITVPPENTTINCASCGTEVHKALWVRVHDCPTCGFEVDRDLNAALNILSRGLDELGVVLPEDTPVETATSVSTDGSGFSATEHVDASRVVEAGSCALKDAGTPAE